VLRQIFEVGFVVFNAFFCFIIVWYTYFKRFPFLEIYGIGISVNGRRGGEDCGPFKRRELPSCGARKRLMAGFWPMGIVVPDPHPPSRPLPPPPKDDGRKGASHSNNHSNQAGSSHAAAHGAAHGASHGASHAASQQQRNSHVFKPMVSWNKSFSMFVFPNLIYFYVPNQWRLSRSG